MRGSEECQHVSGWTALQRCWEEFQHVSGWTTVQRHREEYQYPVEPLSVAPYQHEEEWNSDHWHCVLVLGVIHTEPEEI